MNRYALLLLLAISMNTTGCDRDEAPDDASMDSTVPPVDAGDVGPSIARIWNDAALDAIRRDLPAPGVHARNLFHVSVAMYDAWAAYETEADGYVVHEKVGALDVAARRAAISHAAYRVLRTRYAVSVSSAVILAELDLTFSALGYDALDVRTTGTDGVALGNRIAETVLAHFSNDGATNMMGTYGDPTYMPVNAPLVVSMPGATLADVTRWQPLYLDAMVSQNGIPVPETTQGFVGARWGGVRPFALEREDPLAPYHDPGAPPRLGGVGDARMRAEVTEVLRLQSLLDPTSPETINLSPNSLGNNALGRNDGRGYGINPITGMPYADRVVPLADFGRVLAEYWADGPESETPPGHWNVIANEVADDARFERRFFGTGDLVDPLEWDVVVYFMLNGALHDAAICAWGIKRHYDSIRPISLIRYMATQGQASDSMLPSYDVDGLELVPGLVELITSATTAVGERHEALAGYEGEIAVRGWRGQPQDAANQVAGIGWIRARTWVPYQRSTFVTPAFASFVSGHSTFSRAAAVVLSAITGSEFFPGGLATFDAAAHAYLIHEDGPTTDVRLEWATYYDAADQAGLSRLYGGIHFPADDISGRIAGDRVGRDAIGKALTYVRGYALP